MAKGILFIFCGIVGILVAIFGKNFHAADIVTGTPYKQKIPRWKGCLIFLVVGLFFWAIGVKFLL